MEKQINELATAMVKRIANRYLDVQNKWEGMDAQRSSYLKAVTMLKHLMTEYREVIKHSQEK